MEKVLSKQEELQFDSTATKDSKGSVILGRLTGPVADIINPTRNNRKYSEKLWEKVFADPIVKEYFNCGGVFGELGHPTDREETDMEKIAICMPQPPKKDNDGHLIASFDILDTPNGRILKTLCQYGYKMGISSRGSGDTFTDYDGQEAVDPETYQFNAFDVVLLPAVKAARLNFTESLNNKVSLKQALVENLNNANADERKIMQETLDNLDIKLDESLGDYFQKVHDEDETLWNTHNNDYSFIYDTLSKYGDIEKDGIAKVFDSMPKNEQTDLFVELVSKYKPYTTNYTKNQHESDDIDVKDPDQAVDNNEAMVEELQQTLKQKQKLESQVIELQEKLSVCYAKESNLNEALTKYKQVIGRLSEGANKAKALEEKVSKLQSSSETLNKQLTASNEKIHKLEETAKLSMERRHSLKESNLTKDAEISKLNESIKTLEECSKAKNESLNESIAELQKDLSLKKAEYSKKIENANKLIEKYKKVATTAVDKYIDSQAIKLGVSSNEIKNRLPESYSFDDIDLVCEDMQSYKLTLSKLPFRANNLKENVQVKATASKKESILPVSRFDDEVDDTLLSLAGLK